MWLEAKEAKVVLQQAATETRTVMQQNANEARVIMQQAINNVEDVERSSSTVYCFFVLAAQSPPQGS